MKKQLLALLMSGMLSSLAAAAEVNPLPSCHRLMTDAECNEHLNMLATLPRGAALDRYLAEYARTKTEREIACSCTHSNPTAARTILPLQRQALRF
jgi:Flp pilus assembly protein TadD